MPSILSFSLSRIKQNRMKFKYLKFASKLIFGEVLDACRDVSYQRRRISTGAILQISSAVRLTVLCKPCA